MEGGRVPALHVDGFPHVLDVTGSPVDETTAVALVSVVATAAQGLAAGNARTHTHTHTHTRAQAHALKASEVRQSQRHTTKRKTTQNARHKREHGRRANAQWSKKSLSNHSVRASRRRPNALSTDRALARCKATLTRAQPGLEVAHKPAVPPSSSPPAPTLATSSRARRARCSRASRPWRPKVSSARGVANSHGTSGDEISRSPTLRQSRTACGARARLGARPFGSMCPARPLGTVPRKHVHLACRDVAALAVHSFVHVFDSASACDHVAATRAVERVAA